MRRVSTRTTKHPLSDIYLHTKTPFRRMLFGMAFYTNSHLKHSICTASFPPRLCFVPLARTSSTPRFTQLCRNEKSAMHDAMF